jgi:hypothetical protein
MQHSLAPIQHQHGLKGEPEWALAIADPTNAGNTSTRSSQCYRLQGKPAAVRHSGTISAESGVEDDPASPWTMTRFLLSKDASIND